MASERLKRLAVQWGGLALVAQLWVALRFFHVGELELRTSRGKFVDFNTTADRMSQLKPALFKYPYLAFYLSIAAVLLITILGFLWIGGLWEAMKADDATNSEPNANDPTVHR